MASSLSKRDSCFGQSSPMSMAAGEAEIRWIRGSERGTDECFPGLEEKA